MENERENVIETVGTTETFSYCYEDKFQMEDIENRRLYINEAIDESTIDNIVYHIFRYNRIDKAAGIPAEERQPIIIYINTPGGTAVDGFGVIDAIETSVTPVYTVNMAFAASMGFLVFIAGKKRFTMPHAEFLMHEGSTGDYGNLSKVKDRIEFETVQLEEMTRKYILSHTNIDESLYDNKFRVEWYFLAEEAKRIGAVDCIVGKDCSIEDIL